MSMLFKMVLVRPRNPLNIGAAARAMANFGFENLTIVDPYAPTWKETTSAVGAQSLLQKAAVTQTVDEAVKDCQLVLGTTTVWRRRLERPVVALPNLRKFLKKVKTRGVLKTALLFGSEKTGLSSETLELCHAYLNIPTSSLQPSMNLSHAVALCCYELGKQSMKFKRGNGSFASSGEIEQLVKHILELFGKAGHRDYESLKEKRRKLRQSLLRWKLKNTDVLMLHGILRAILKKMELK